MSIKDYPRGQVATQYGPLRYTRITATHVILETGSEPLTLDGHPFNFQGNLIVLDAGEWGIHERETIYINRRWNLKDSTLATAAQTAAIRAEVIRAWNEFAATNPEETVTIKRINLNHNLDRINASIGEHAQSLSSLQAQRDAIDREIHALDSVPE